MSAPNLCRTAAGPLSIDVEPEPRGREGRRARRMYEGTKHTSATEALRGGRRLEEIQHALGHRDRRSTERYARLPDGARVEDLFRRR
jgi:hypothetical protein